MRHPLNLTSALFLAFAAPALVAQTPSAWSGALNRPLDQVLVQARVVTMDGNQYLQFRNDGQEAINFYFSINGGDPFTGSRVHVNAHKRSAYLPLPAGTSANSFKFAMLRKGRDQGPVLPD